MFLLFVFVTMNKGSATIHLDSLVPNFAAPVTQALFDTLLHDFTQFFKMKLILSIKTKP